MVDNGGVSWENRRQDVLEKGYLICYFVASVEALLFICEAQTNTNKDNVHSRPVTPAFQLFSLLSPWAIFAGRIKEITLFPGHFFYQYHKRHVLSTTVRRWNGPDFPEKGIRLAMSNCISTRSEHIYMCVRLMIIHHLFTTFSHHP